MVSQHEAAETGASRPCSLLCRIVEHDLGRTVRTGAAGQNELRINGFYEKAYLQHTSCRISQQLQAG